MRRAGERALERVSPPWTIRPADWFEKVERLRTLFAGVAGADADGVAVVPATSYGLAVAARNVMAVAGDRVALLAGDFPSNVHTWQAWARGGAAPSSSASSANTVRLGPRPYSTHSRIAAERVHVELLGSVIRVSTHLHVTGADVERLLAALDAALAETP